MLPRNHVDKNSYIWRKTISNNAKNCLWIGVLNGSIPSAASNTRATAITFKLLDPTIPTGTQSTSSFGGAFRLHHKLQEPSHSAHIMQQVKDSLLSTSKMVNANHIAMYNKDKVNFYDATTTKIVIMDKAALTGWQDPKVGMWWVPLIDKPTNLNTNTLILDHPTKLESLNSAYIVNTTMATWEHIRAKCLSCLQWKSSTTYTNYQALSSQFGTFMQQWDTPNYQPG